MLNRAKIALTGLGMAVMLVTSTGLAADADCTVGTDKRNYDAAKKKEQRYVEKLFETSYGCRAFSAFSSDMYNLAASAKSEDPCETNGMRDGILETITKIRNQCIGGGALTEDDEAEEVSSIGACSRSGVSAGMLAASAFCTTPEAGVPPTPSLCDAIAAQACHDTFEDYVIKTCPDKRINYRSKYNALVDAACAPPTS